MKRWNRKKMIFLILSVIIGIPMLYCFHHLHSFLAITKRVDTKTLVIEHWLFDYMIDQAADEIKTGGYERVLVIQLDEHEYIDTLKTCEEIQRLIHQGVDSTIITMIDMPDLRRHRTFTSAFTIRNWITRNPIPDEGFNVYSGGPHARKSYVAFMRILGRSYKIGIIASPIQYYNEKYWWSTRRGFFATMKNFIGYFYAIVWKINIYK